MEECLDERFSTNLSYNRRSSETFTKSFKSTYLYVLTYVRHKGTLPSAFFYARNNLPLLPLFPRLTYHTTIDPEKRTIKLIKTDNAQPFQKSLPTIYKELDSQRRGSTLLDRSTGGNFEKSRFLEYVGQESRWPSTGDTCQLYQLTSLKNTFSFIYTFRF